MSALYKKVLRSVNTVGVDTALVTAGMGLVIE